MRWAPRWSLTFALGCTAFLLAQPGLADFAESRTVWSTTDVRVNDPSATFGGPPLGVREPVVVVNPNDPNVMVAAAIDLNVDNVVPESFGAVRVYRSLDGGASWLDGGILRGADPSDPWRSGDPSLVYREDGSLFLAILASSHDDPTAGGLEVYGSVDDGATWSGPYAAVRPVVNPGGRVCRSPDKELITANPATGELLVAYTEFQRRCGDPLSDFFAENLGLGSPDGSLTFQVMLLRSSDSGETWSAPLPIWDGYALGAAPAVGPDGTIYVAFAAKETIGTTGACPSALGSLATYRPSEFELVVASSTDDGATWRYERRLLCEAVLYPAATPTVGGAFVPSISVDQSDGRAYVVWPSFASNPLYAIEVMSSADGGESWSETGHVTPFQLDDSVMPSISAADGVARAIWMTTPDTGDTFDTFAAESLDGGVTWSTPRPISTETSTGVRGAADLGDYIWIDVRAGRVAAAWTDFRSGEATDIYVRTGVVE